MNLYENYDKSKILNYSEKNIPKIRRDAFNDYSFRNYGFLQNVID